MQINATEIVIAIVGLVFSAVIIPLTRAAFVWLKGRTHNEALATAIDEAQTVADNVIARLMAGVVDGLKEESEDGRLSAEEAASIMDTAVDMVISDLSAGTLKLIEDNADDISAYLCNLIEARLLNTKIKEEIMSYTQTEETINQQYAQQLAAQKAQLQAQRDQAQAEYELQRTGATDTYNEMRKTAHVDSAMADRARRESMANMGLSSAGGMSQSLAQRGRNALMGAVGSANKQEQDYKNNIDLALGNLNTQYDANISSAESQNNAALNAELSQYSQWQANYDMQQQQMEQSQQSAIFDQAYALYVKRKISRRQFEQMTGLDLG